MTNEEIKKEFIRLASELSGFAANNNDGDTDFMLLIGRMGQGDSKVSMFGKIVDIASALAMVMRDNIQVAKMVGLAMVAYDHFKKKDECDFIDNISLN